MSSQQIWRLSRHICCFIKEKALPVLGRGWGGALGLGNALSWKKTTLQSPRAGGISSLSGGYPLAIGAVEGDAPFTRALAPLPYRRATQPARAVRVSEDPMSLRPVGIRRCRVAANLLHNFVGDCLAPVLERTLRHLGNRIGKALLLAHG